MMLKLTLSYLKHKNRTALRGVRDEDTKESYYDRANNTLDGLPVVDLKSDQFKRRFIRWGLQQSVLRNTLQHVLQNFRRWSIINCTKC